jgi:hypothetical protein
MAKPRAAAPSFRDRMVYLISPVNLRGFPLGTTKHEIDSAATRARVEIERGR